jgi:hypothetical protein
VALHIVRHRLGGRGAKSAEAVAAEPMWCWGAARTGLCTQKDQFSICKASNTCASLSRNWKMEIRLNHKRIVARVYNVSATGVCE